ncbi:uncharacterized protein PgNI_07429 [Pyricularia grisea]|uniref:Uncharacterized protein n=1 Tax=Pyricularia grisea TaxID=148305 RepID=A0A6P8B1N9_PYRGI|nr:uncharacterized protein PgNI_07429 [Pyricularia grisea]TLD08744.1 hypothetical protein PgNI_07429 [Pyricularia grisea]
MLILTSGFDPTNFLDDPGGLFGFRQASHLPQLFLREIHRKPEKLLQDEAKNLNVVDSCLEYNPNRSPRQPHGNWLATGYD